MWIIQYVDTHPSMKQTDVAAHFQISPSTLAGIIKNREKIVTACSSPDARADSAFSAQAFLPK